MDILKITKINEEMTNNPYEYIKKCEEKFVYKVKKAVNYIEEKNIKYVFISGPSSSGKTTFSKGIVHYLKSKKLITISLDDYYKTLNDMPKKKDGDYNFESVYSLRLKDMEEDFKKLISGEDVYIPLVDFETGKRVEDHSSLRADDDTIVVIEGLHALNEKILSMFKDEKIFKIFIRPEPKVECKDGNLISIYDVRFVRRMVRDNNYRNSDARNSLRMWQSVRDGEKIYMDKYRKTADVRINTFLNYEPCILKNDAIELLSEVKEGETHYIKARRIINNLSEFISFPKDSVPENSLLNEFIKK